MAEKYYLCKLKSENHQWLPILDLYDIGREDRSSSKSLDSILVNFSSGMHLPIQEASANSTNLPPAVIHNCNIQSAHHDIILPSKIPRSNGDTLVNIPRLTQGKQVMESMKSIQDSQGISLALSDMINLDIHEMACQMTPVGSFMDSPMVTSEDKFWRLWKIDVELCLSHIVFFQGIEQIWNARYVKGSVNVGKSLGQLQHIRLELSQLEQVPNEGVTGIVFEYFSLVFKRVWIIFTHALRFCHPYSHLYVNPFCITWRWKAIGTKKFLLFIDYLKPNPWIYQHYWHYCL
jgi:hypothetical protein